MISKLDPSKNFYLSAQQLVNSVLHRAGTYVCELFSQTNIYYKKLLTEQVEGKTLQDICKNDSASISLTLHITFGIIELGKLSESEQFR